jgi:hypothetical protein
LKYEIVASMKDRSRSFKTVESDAVGKVELEPIVLKPVDRIVTGTVVDENDVPVANAQVYPYGEDQPELQSAIRADAQGMFSFKACEGKVNVMVGGGEENQLSGNAVVEAGSNFVKVVIFDRTPKNYKPVKGQKVDGLQEYVSGLDTAGLQGKRLLILFVDINQFPADIVGQNASEQFRKLQAKGVEVIGIQVNKCDAVKFDEWVQKVKCPFSFYIAKNGDELRSKFGVNQVPWIILTDSNHVVSAEGVNGSDFEKELGLHL